MTSYDDAYSNFNSELLRNLRQEAYGEDIGQHSWVTAEQVRADILNLRLTPESRLLDLGSGPCGPLIYVLDSLGCRGVGVELSVSALHAGQERAQSKRVGELLTTLASDLNDRLPFESHSFDGVMALDSVLHVQDRLALFQEVARLLVPNGRFLFTDAGIITGAISSDEVRLRSGFGYTQFVPMGWNEKLLEASGLKVLRSEDRTDSVVSNATGRLSAMRSHRSELEPFMEGGEFEQQEAYLEAVVELAGRRALSRIAYLAEA